MNNILVVGLGKVGCLVAQLLNKQYKVIGLDLHQPYYTEGIGFETIKGDVSDFKVLQKASLGMDAIVSALPFHLNKNVAKCAKENNLHYFDLTEDVETTNYIKTLAEDSTKVMAPQCGLAPGLIGIVGGDLAQQFDEIRDIELRVGALPRYPNGQLAYSFTWSPKGVLNEYLNDAKVIQNGVCKDVPSLDGFEMMNVEGQELEAFSTSGGLGTMCETYEGRVDTLNYKTIRYPGHGKLMRFLMYELILKKDLETLEKILTDAKPPVDADLVHVYAIVEGKIKEKMYRKEYFKTFYPLKIDDHTWRAISWTTAASLAAIVELVAEGKIATKGFIKQEEINLNDFYNTSNGKLFL